MVRVEIEDYNGNTIATLHLGDFDIADFEEGKGGRTTIRLQDTIKNRTVCSKPLRLEWVI